MEKRNSDQEHASEIIQIQANIDDMNPELYPHVLDCLFDAGARDAYLIPIIMKKGRPGILINILLDATFLDKIETILFQETTTLGIRYFTGTCHRLKRTFEKIKTPWGPVNIKMGYLKEQLVNIKPEFQDCQKIAKDNEIPLKEIYSFIYKQINNLLKVGKK